jgi:beta-N-acetylhexosaminidase
MFCFPRHVKPGIFGILSTHLQPAERELFKTYKPSGIILFQRNCQNTDQVKALTADIKKLLGFDCPILIDQEGGRVSRLKNPQFKEYSAPASFRNNEDIFENAFEMALQLKDLGINVNCTPLADLVFDETHAIIGDRSFGNDPKIVAEKAAIVINAHLKVGIMPIIKHLPGHGRAVADSHEDLPIVNASLHDLEMNDFKAFKEALQKSEMMPWGMTAHIIYNAVDEQHCATQSRKVINDIIRKAIGFSGILLSDCLTMKALKGSYKDRAQKSLEAGCDIILHCSGNLFEMEEILQNI